MKEIVFNKEIWLKWAGSFSVILIAFYIILHLVCEEGQEVRVLHRDQLVAINTLIINDSNERDVRPQIENYIMEVMHFDTVSIVTELLETYSNEELMTILPTFPFKTYSFFWLVGSRVFIEIIFWSLFGLMANLMYSVTITNAFDRKRIPEHIGKVFYTPFSAIIIYLAINALMNTGTITLEGIGKSVLVLSFILGFFTRRTIVLLGKIKDIILPAGKDDTPKNDDQEKFNLSGNITIDTIDTDTFKSNIQHATVILEDEKTGTIDVMNPTDSGQFEFQSVKIGVYKLESELVINSDRFYGETILDMSAGNEVPIIELNLNKSELSIR